MSNPLGIEVFEDLRAEDEPWLAKVFEMPPEFDLISGARSCIVFGESGAGKSACYQALLRQSSISEQTTKRLVAEWHLRSMNHVTTVDDSFVKCQLSEIFDACAFSVIRYLVQQPEVFGDAPTWAQRILHWFVYNHLRGDFEMRTGILQRYLVESGQSLLKGLMICPEHNLFDDKATPKEIITYLVKALIEVKLHGVWVLVDQENLSEEDEHTCLTTGLHIFLSHLKLFEQSSFAYKIFLPITLRTYLTQIVGSKQRRLNVYYLQWTSEKLAALLVKRLSLALGSDLNQLNQICSDPSLVIWLERCGGMTPRGWLEQFRPLAAAYLYHFRQGENTAITSREWHEIRRRHPPMLSFNYKQRVVWVGERSVELTEEQCKIFGYLYDHGGQICTRSELYYLAYLGLKHEPRTPADSSYEPPNQYRGLIETTIWRLRQSIEPDDETGIFIITVKGKGYRLDHS